MPHASQPNHQPSIQAFLEWEQKDSTLRKGTAGSQNDQAQSYVPISALNDHFGEEVSVRKIISDLRLPQSPDPAYVWNHYRRVFAILLSINNGSMIGQFTNRQYLIDQYLPFRSRPPDFPASDDDSLWGAFYKRQWKFCPVPMPNGMRGEQPAEAILPFTIKEQIGQGKSASIHKIEVDSEYNSLVSQNAQSQSSDSKSTFVLKRYWRSEAEKDFGTETQAFEKLHSSGRPLQNIVACHGSFIRGGVYYIILEYADQGNLGDLMRRRASPATGEEIIQFWEALTEVLYGLDIIHEIANNDSSSSEIMCGWHQDIKPENILVKSKAGSSKWDVQLMVADLGLSHFKTSKSGGTQEIDEDTHGSRAYGAPETFRINESAQNAPRKVSRSVDIFSMACIYSEVATWIVHNQDKLEEYRDQRREEVARKLKNHDDDDGDMFHDGAKVLDTVINHHESLKLARQTDDFITIPIVQKIIPDMMHGPRSRLTAPQASDKMTILLREARENLKDLHEGRDPRHAGKDTNLPAAGPSSIHIPGRGSLQETPSVPWVGIDAVIEKKDRNELPKLPDRHYLNHIKGRDNVFIVDNSNSMLGQKVEARKVLLALAYLVKNYDPNGIDLKFTQSSRKVTNATKSKKFMEEFDRVEFEGETAMNIILGDLLRAHKRRITESITESRGIMGKVIRKVRPQNTRPLSLYILTNGKWLPGSEPDGVIRDMVDFLDKHKDDVHEKQVAIQFVSFGDAQTALDLLDFLDDEMKLKMDIVDHTPSNDNVWKMILGAILSIFDRQNPSQSPLSSAKSPVNHNGAG